MLIAKAGLRNSDGCNDIPRLSQRRAPLTLNPATGTSIRPTSIAKPSRMPSRRAFSRLSIEAPSIASKPTNCQRR